jgi:hypothetical protein
MASVLKWISWKDVDVEEWDDNDSVCGKGVKELVSLGQGDDGRCL